MLFKLFIICVFLSIIFISARGEEDKVPKDDLQPPETANEGDLATAESFFWPWFYKPWFGYGPYFKFKVRGGYPGYGYWGR